MAYKDGTKPQKGDAVLGSIGGAPARGKVLHYNEKTDELTIHRHGDAVLHAKSGQMIQGALEQVPAAAADFELIYRHPAPAKRATAVTAATKEA